MHLYQFLNQEIKLDNLLNILPEGPIKNHIFDTEQKIGNFDKTDLISFFTKLDEKTKEITLHFVFKGK